MDNIQYRKPTAIYCLLIGIINLITWTFLILSDKIGNIESDLIAYIFHWISEAGTSILLIFTGYSLLKKLPSAYMYLFFSLGFLFMSIGGAFVYYLVHPYLPIFILSTLISGSTIIFLIMNYNSLKDFIFLTLGISIYALINITGNALIDMNFTLITMSVPALIFLCILASSMLNKDIVFRYLRK